MQARKQAGWTMWSLMFTLFVVGFAAWMGLKIVPEYLDNNTIRSVLKPLGQDRSLSEASYDEISTLIVKRLDINSIYSIKPKDITYVENENHLQVRIDYEKRIPMVSNIDVVLTFKNHVNIQSN
ncbi:DUF4845 domain-containing protein [Litoribacillus peritrichatus]|uniref:DUF4845 domain-containing protein n=1 Tax=Litoribacillus peritrichatus TaxID=718191 RepID=A0ABP7NAG9_9GAMM